MKLFDTFLGKKKAQKANNDGHYKIQSHLAEYLEFLMSFFLNYEDIKTMFKFKNEPNNLNGVINFALFLDITTNLPDIFTGHSTKELTNIVHGFVKGTVNAIPGLSGDFGENRVYQATERIMYYMNLSINDLKNENTPNYHSLSEFLKETFSGKITNEEKTVLINMLAVKFPPVKALIFMKIQ